MIIDGSNDQQEQELISMSYAVINGIGSTWGDKKFKFINPYEDTRKESNKKENAKQTKEQVLKDMDDLKKMFRR